MESFNYFYINNQKFNYTLEFQSSNTNNYWKHNAPLIEYCETLGIVIPHYCYHKNLSISGNCRMCLVELKNSPKPVVSCAMSAKSCLNNVSVFTDSPLVKKARENILEFLLLNHPLDCPICDQGGECDLQDQSLYFGISKSRFYNFKRIVTDKNIGPIVKTVMTRCIHCTRCVRFSTEIAGTEDLGMFGRGLDSEIGTYVKKSFNSELSGNVTDLCPVGALTLKPYPFLSRSWELKTVNSIDFSDGFGVNLLVSIKNNKIVKINPSYENSQNTNNWISDKSRFSFEGMFSPERVLNGFIKFSTKTTQQHNWSTLIKEIITTLYFQNHLNNHFLKNYKLIIVFSNNTNLEVLNLLNLFSQKYKFIELRKFEGQHNTNTFEFDFLTESNQKDKLKNSTLCLLLGMNSRYENTNFNLSLRQRSLNGDFKIISLGSNKNLTFPTINLGLNIKTLHDISAGNSPFCVDFIEASNPTIAISSSVLYRKDYKSVSSLLSFLKKKLSEKNFTTTNLEILNTSINESGVNYLNNFKSMDEKDYSSSCGIYFLNNHPSSNNFKRLIKLSLLNYVNKNKNWPNYCFNQSFGLEYNSSKYLQTTNNLYNYINLPNNTFFESTGTYLNTEGQFKYNVKFISTNNQSKEDWQIIRKVFSNFENVSLLNSSKKNYITNYKSNFNLFKNFTTLLYYSSSIINNKTDYSINKNYVKKYYFNNFTKLLKHKLFLTKLNIWINDFYIGGTDSYSRYSPTMINCSKLLRSTNNNFSHLV